MAETELILANEVPVGETKVVSYAVPIRDVLIAAANAKLETVESIEIDDDSMMELAAGELGDVKKARKGLDGLRKASVDPVRAALDAINEIYDVALKTYEKAEKLCTSKMLAYRAAQEEARRKAQVEAERLAAQERKRLTEEAAALAAAGHTEEALATQTVAAAVSVAPSVPPPPKIAGTSFRKNWKARVVDKRAFAAYIAEHPEMDECWDGNLTKLGQIAKAQEASMNIPGVEAYNDSGIASRS